MNFLLCCADYYPSVGGVQEVVRQIAEGLFQRGHNVTVATSYLSTRTKHWHNGVVICDFKITGNLVEGLKGEIKEYREFIKNFKCDAILVKAAQQWSFDALWPILDEIEVRKIFIPCGFSKLRDPNYQDYFNSVSQILFKWDHLIFYSDTYQDIQFAKKLGIRNITVLPNGASETEFERPIDRTFGEQANISIDQDAKVLLTVGSLTGLKGHLEVLLAFSKMKCKANKVVLILNGHTHRKSNNSNDVVSRLRSLRVADRRVFRHFIQTVCEITKCGVRWCMHEYFEHTTALKSFIKRFIGIGDVPEGKYLERLLKKLINKVNRDPNKKVVFVDLDRTQLIQAYFRADLFVFASRIECSPLVLYESAAAGTPFLSVPVGNAEEIAIWTRAGKVVNSLLNEDGLIVVDTENFAREIEEMLSQESLMVEMGGEGRQRWKTYFTWSKLVVHYEEILIGKKCTVRNFRV